MNKAFYIICASIFFPGLVFAGTGYVRLAPDSLLSSVTTISVSVADYDRDINCGGLKFWGIQAVEHQTGAAFSSSPRFVPADILEITFAIDMPPGDYEEITFACSDDGENLAFQYGSLESDLDGDQIIFAASAVPSITSDLGDEEIVTVSIDGDAISKFSTTTEVAVDVPDDNVVELSLPTMVAEGILSETAVVFGAGDDVLGALVDGTRDSVIEEAHATSSVTGDTTANGTTTTTF